MDDHIVVGSNMMCAVDGTVAAIAAAATADPAGSSQIVSANLRTLQSAECLFSFREND